MSSSDIVKKDVSPKLSNLIAEVNFSIESVKEKILAAYHYAIEQDGYTPTEAASLLRERLFFSTSYIRRILPSEAKIPQMTREKKYLAPQEHEISELEKFRQRGRVGTVGYGAGEEEEEDELSAKIPDEIGERRSGESESSTAEVIYDQPEKIIKQYEEKIEELAKPFTVRISVEYKNQILPLIVGVDPEEKDVSVELDREELKKLQQ